MLLKLEDVLCNPNRDLTFNPYNENKIAELMFSIEKRAFGITWSLGSHRSPREIRTGLRSAPCRGCAALWGYGGEFIVKELDDDKMLRMMDLENSKEYGYSILSLLEVVKAVVNALAEGRIPPFKLVHSKEDNIRYAPSFIPGKKPSSGNLPLDKPYTVLDIAKHLGTKYLESNPGTSTGKGASRKIRVALDTLWLLETKDLTIASVKDQNIDQLYKITSDIKRRKNERNKAQAETTAEATKLHAELAKADADRRAAEEKERLKQVELQRKQAEAKKRQDEETAERLSVEFKRRTEDAEKRALHFAEKRAILDAKIKENEERVQLSREQDKELPVRHAASTCLTKLKTIVSERNALREELRTLGLKALTQSERENIRQALLAAATWFEEQSVAFRPALQTDVLKEAREKEAAKHKRGASKLT